MDIIWVLFFGCFSLIFASDNLGNITNKKDKIELFPPTPTYAGQTRMPRAFFKKAAFLTGLKIGAILSKKGFELGHGKIASTHSFQIFGKPVNSAMSLSYGNVGSLLPLVDDTPQSEDSLKRTSLKKEDKKIFQVTVVENAVNETADAVHTHSQMGVKKVGDDESGINENIVTYQDPVGEQQETEIKSNFLKEHNKIVKEFNEEVFRRNNKY